MSESENPVISAPEPEPHRPRSNKDWWPEQLDLSVLRPHEGRVDPRGAGFRYADAFAGVDVDELRRELVEVMHTSQDWWPSDYGHYGPLFIRMAWHVAGTYRIADGRGGGGAGLQRFAPLNSWPDNANLDKARRLLWPIKQKHGDAVSWADLIVLAGNVALEDHGLRDLRLRIRSPGRLRAGRGWSGARRTPGRRRRYSGRPWSSPDPLRRCGAVWPDLRHPEGRIATPIPFRGPSTSGDVRCMAMDDEETVALIAAAHLRQVPGAASADHIGTEPEGCPVHATGPRMAQHLRHGAGPDTITSGLEGAWTVAPTRWDNGYLDNLFGYDWSSPRARPGPSSGPRRTPGPRAPCPTPLTTRRDATPR